MAVFDLDRMVQLSDCWFPLFLDAVVRGRPAGQLLAAEQWIDLNVFDAAKARRTKTMNVTEAVRISIPANPDWNNTPLQALFHWTGHSFDDARKALGNLVCRVGIRRPEMWYRFAKDMGGDHRSSTYVLSSSLPR